MLKTLFQNGGCNMGDSHSLWENSESSQRIQYLLDLPFFFFLSFSPALSFIPPFPLTLPFFSLFRSSFSCLDVAFPRLVLLGASSSLSSSFCSAAFLREAFEPLLFSLGLSSSSSSSLSRGLGFFFCLFVFGGSSSCPSSSSSRAILARRCSLALLCLVLTLSSPEQQRHFR